MRFGVCIPTYDRYGDPEVLRRLIAEAERLAVGDPEHQPPAPSIRRHYRHVTVQNVRRRPRKPRK